MKPSSAKAKGRTFQQWVRDLLLGLFLSLEPDDIRSTSMGANGEDLLFSPAARKLLPFSVECKSYAKIAVYRWYEQAKVNAGKNEPLLVMKENRSKPLVVVDAEYFFKLVKGKTSGTNSEAKEA